MISIWYHHLYRNLDRISPWDTRCVRRTKSKSTAKQQSTRFALVRHDAVLTSLSSVSYTFSFWCFFSFFFVQRKWVVSLFAPAHSLFWSARKWETGLLTVLVDRMSSTSSLETRIVSSIPFVNRRKLLYDCTIRVTKKHGFYSCTFNSPCFSRKRYRQTSKNMSMTSHEFYSCTVIFYSSRHPV